jgi:hypothetical protein
MRIGKSKNVDKVINGGGEIDANITVTTMEESITVTETVEEFPIYWKLLEVDSEGNMTIKIYGEASKERFDSLKDTRAEYLNKLKSQDTLARAQAKFDLIDSLIKDDDRTRVIPGKSLLFGNNIEIMPERVKGEKEGMATKTTTTTVKTSKKTETTIIRREA